MLRPLLRPAAKRLKTAKWQLAAALVAVSIPVFSQAQTKVDILVNHDAFPLQAGGGSIDSAASVNGPVGGHFAYRAKVKTNGASAVVKDVTLTQLLPAGAIFQGVGTVPEGKTTGEPVLPTGVACLNLPATGSLLAQATSIECTIQELTSTYVEVDFRVVLPEERNDWYAYASAVAENNNDPIESNHARIERNVTTYKRADLAVNIIGPVEGQEFTQGEVVTYELQASNTNGAYSFPLNAGEKAHVRFPEPAGGVFQLDGSAVNEGWICIPDVDTTSDGTTVNVQDCTYKVPTGKTIEPGAELPLLYVFVRLDAGDGSVGASVSINGTLATGGVFLESNSDNNSDSVIVKVKPNKTLDMAVTKTVTPTFLDEQAILPANFTYTIKVKRVGDAWITPEGVKIIDVMPLGMTFVSGNGSGWSCPEGPLVSTEPYETVNVTCTYNGQVASNGDLKDLTIVGRVDDAAALENFKKVSGNLVSLFVDNESESSPQENNASVATVVVTNDVNLEIDKRTPTTLIHQGGDYVYNITISNKSQIDVKPGQTISVQDQLDPYLQFLGVEAGSAWACSPEATSGTELGKLIQCDLKAGIKAGKSSVLTLNVQAHLPGGMQFAKIDNKANVSGIGGRGDGNDVIGKIVNSNTVRVSDVKADLRMVSKTAALADPDNRISGAEVIYTLVVKNDVPEKAGDNDLQMAQTVEVTDTVVNLITTERAKLLGVEAYKSSGRYLTASVFLPKAAIDAGVTADDCKLSGNNESNKSTVSCLLHNVPADETLEYEITINARQYVDPSSDDPKKNKIDNVALVSSPDTAEYDVDNNKKDASIVLEALANLTVTKQASNDKGFFAGGRISYSFTVKNEGPTKAAQVKAVDTLPLQTIWVGGAPNIEHGGACALANGDAFADGLVITEANRRMTCSWPSQLKELDGQEIVSYQLRSVNEGYPEKLENTVHVSTGTLETNYNDNDAKEAVTLDKPQVDVLINMGHTDDGIPLGDGQTRYTITVMNNGASMSYATGVHMENLFPVQGSTAQFDFVEMVSVTSKNGNTNYGLSNCTPPAVGSTEGPLVCDFPWLAPGEFVEISFIMKPTVLLDGRAVGTINHTATVSADLEQMPELDVLANNQTTDRTSTYDPDQIDPDEVDKLRFIDLSLKKEADAPTGGIAVGSNITYRLIVTNEEKPNVAEPLHLRNGNAVVTDKLPEGLELDGTAPAGCDYAPDTRTLVCTVTELDAGASTTFEFSVKVESLAPSQTSVLNKALLTSPGDPVEPNNKDDADVPVGEVDLSLVKSVDKTEAEVGDTLVYSLVVTNHGPMNSTGAVVTDLWPEELQLVSADAACQLDAGEVRCDVGELASGASKTFQLSAIVGDAALGMMVTNVAKVKAPGDKKPENDESTTTTEVPEKSPGTDWPEEKPEPEEPEEKPTPTPVPTMGTAGLILMSLMVAGMAGLRQRRRR